MVMSSRGDAVVYMMVARNIHHGSHELRSVLRIVKPHIQGGHRLMSLIGPTRDPL